MATEKNLEKPQEQQAALLAVAKMLSQFAAQSKKFEFTLPAGTVLSNTKEEAVKRKQYEDVAKTGKLPAIALTSEVVGDTLNNIAKNIYLDKLRGIL